MSPWCCPIFGSPAVGSRIPPPYVKIRVRVPVGALACPRCMKNITKCINLYGGMLEGENKQEGTLVIAGHLDEQNLVDEISDKINASAVVTARVNGESPLLPTHDPSEPDQQRWEQVCMHCRDNRSCRPSVAVERLNCFSFNI